MKTYPIYAGGRFVPTNEKLSIYSSFNNRIVAETYIAGEKELEDSILAAQAVSEELKYMPAYKKYNILMQISSLLEKNCAQIAEVLAMEASKPLKFAVGEVQRAIQTFIVAAEEAKRLPKEYFSIDWTKAGEGKEGFVKYFPIGLVAGISPFNFPLNLAVHKLLLPLQPAIQLF
jgi:acyl-CoA reductase-like NAD-dependent aldehyde dehydrogenase